MERRRRRQQLSGFDDVYSCTHRIWEEKDVGLIASHYSADCPVRTLSGVSGGARAVTEATLAAIAAHPDRSPVTEDVIWSEDEPGTFLSSHRIVSFATHLGSDPTFGPPTCLRQGVRVIADCLCRENLIVDEWLARDNAQVARELGLEPLVVAQAQAEADRRGDRTRHAWRSAEIERVRNSPSVTIADDHPAAPVAAALDLAFNHDLFGQASTIVAQRAECRWPTGRHLWGRAGWSALMIQLAAPLTDRRLRIDHAAARPLPGGDVAVALRWMLTGHHRNGGVWGRPSGRELLVLAISHFRLRCDRIIEDDTLFDELAILRQIEGGLGA
jgi:hypothetical protein